MLMEGSLPHSKRTRLFVVMGVAGSGKTTIGEALAMGLSGQFIDGDSFHPQANIDKMSRGEPLTDADRWPWLQRFGTELAARQGLVVGGCSSLKRIYREVIGRAANEAVMFIYLNGSRALIAKRMERREGHFMPPSLLDSQFKTLEVPTMDEHAISVSIDATTEQIVEDIQGQLAQLS